MWFKNLYLFRFTEDFDTSPKALHEALKKRPFTPCPQYQRESLGFVPPLGKESTQFIHAVNGFILLSLGREERLLPASVIREERDEQVVMIEAKEDRKLSSNEKREISEQIEHQLLPRAFTRYQTLDAWIDPKKGWLVINTTSAKRAEEFTQQLRKALDRLSIELPRIEPSPTYTMTDWLKNNTLPDQFILEQECELVSPDEERSVVQFKRHELESGELQIHLDAGKVATKLGLKWNDRISFILTTDLLIKRLRFLDIFNEMADEHDPQSAAETKDIEFSLMTGEVRNLLTDLFDELEISEKR